MQPQPRQMQRQPMQPRQIQQHRRSNLISRPSIDSRLFRCRTTRRETDTADDYAGRPAAVGGIVASWVDGGGRSVIGVIRAAAVVDGRTPSHRMEAFSTSDDEEAPATSADTIYTHNTTITPTNTNNAAVQTISANPGTVVGTGTVAGTDTAR